MKRGFVPIEPTQTVIKGLVPIPGVAGDRISDDENNADGDQVQSPPEHTKRYRASLATDRHDYEMTHSAVSGKLCYE